MSDMPVSEYASKISALLQERLRIKGRSLSRQLHKSGRRLPRKIKRSAIRVAEAAKLADNPKLARQIDNARVAEDAEQVIMHLKSIDPTQVLKDKVLIGLAKISAALIVVFIAAVWYAHNQGMI